MKKKKPLFTVIFTHQGHEYFAEQWPNCISWGPTKRNKADVTEDEMDELVYKAEEALRFYQ
jgi:hypothetical protein